MTPEQFKNKSLAPLRKKWEQEDWERDIASYTRLSNILKQFPFSTYTLHAMNRIVAKWPGKEKMFK